MEISPEKGFALGAIEGDGWMGKSHAHNTSFNYQMQLGSIDIEFVEYFEKCLKKEYPDIKFSRRIRSTNDGAFKVKTAKPFFETRVSSKSIVSDLLECNIMDILNSNENVQRMYLRGIFDSEASVYCHFTSPSEGTLRQLDFEIKDYTLAVNVKKLLEMQGIQPLFDVRNTGYIRLRLVNRKNLLLFQNLIGFTIERKQRKLKECLDSYKGVLP